MKDGFRPSMAWLHTWMGLLLGWVLYFMFVTGTAGYFDTEIDRWMQPELPRAQTDVPAQTTVRTALHRLQQEAPKATRWLMALPMDRNQPYTSIFWQADGGSEGGRPRGRRQTIDAMTGAPLEARDTAGGQQLYQMHWRLHYLPDSLSAWIVGLASLFMLTAIITGIIVHKKIFKDFFVFRPGKGQRSWLDAHNVLSVLALPFHLMITYSGLVFMGFVYFPLMVAAFYGTGAEAERTLRTEMFSGPGVEASGEPAPLTDLGPLITKAETRWGAGNIRHVDIRHPGDAQARILLRASHAQTPLRRGEELIFHGVTGELLETSAPFRSPTTGVQDILLGLHEGLFAGPLLRWLYFFSGVLGTAMVATGLVLWTVKRRQRAEARGGRAHSGIVLVERLNVGVVAGLLVAIAAYFWANRLLPLEMANRSDWELHLLFLTWLLMLIHGTLRPRRHAWFEQCALAAAAYTLLPLLNFLTTERHLLQTLPNGDWPLAGFDLTVLGLGLALAVAAYRLYPFRSPLPLAAGAARAGGSPHRSGTHEAEAVES